MIAFSPPLRRALQEARAPIIVTGTGGWLGQAALTALQGVFGADLPARVKTFSAAPRPLPGFGLTPLPYAALETLRAAPALILHFAFRTKGHAAEPGYVETNRAIAATMRGFIARNGALGLFIPSSGAVYGPDGQPHGDLAANPYGALKYEDELSFGALAARHAIPLVTARIFNLAGPRMNNLTGYALGSIIMDIVRGGPIQLRAARPVWRAYAHVGDVLAIALSLLLQRQSPPVFDTSGEPVELGALAARAARLLTGADMPIIRPDWEGGVPDRYLGDGDSYARTAALAGVTPRALDEQILDTAAYIKATC
jgi:UDP-glucuronate decarboxylase